MQVLATGLSGFVGSHLRQLVPAVDLLYDGRPADLRNHDEVRAAVAAARPEAVVHLAAQSSVQASFADPVLTCQVNFMGTLHLLLALKEAGFRGRMLYVSSADCYGAVGEAGLPVTEAQALKPLNPYAVSKAAAEALCYQWSRQEAFEIVIARPFNHIGPGQSTHFAVASFARQIAACRAGRGQPSLVVGDTEVTRDFTDVRDVVRAYVALLERGRNGEAYNVCSGVERRLRDVMDALLAAGGVEMQVQLDPQRLRSVEQRRMRGSFAKLQGATGWRPEIPFEQTLVDTLDHWDNKDGA